MAEEANAANLLAAKVHTSNFELLIKILNLRISSTIRETHRLIGFIEHIQALGLQPLSEKISDAYI